MGSPQHAAVLQAFFQQQGITDPAEIQKKIDLIGENAALQGQRQATADTQAHGEAALRRQLALGGGPDMGPQVLADSYKALSTPGTPSLKGVPIGAGPKPTPKTPTIPTPPAVDKPQGTVPAPVDVKTPDKRVIIRRGNTFTLEEPAEGQTASQIADRYKQDVGGYVQENSGLKEREKALAAEAADKIERTNSPSTGYWPGGVQGRTGSPVTVGDNGQGSVGDAQARRGGGAGAFSYMGTSGFSLDKKYTDSEYANLHPSERSEIDQIEQAVAARNMRDVEVRKARALAEQDSDPVGYRQRQVEQYMSSAREQLGDPKSFLHTQYQMNMRDFIAKNPKATPEEIQNFAMFLQDKLTTQQAEADAARYGQWIAAQDPRVLSSAARNPFAGMFGGGAGAGGTAP